MFLPSYFFVCFSAQTEEIENVFNNAIFLDSEKSILTPYSSSEIPITRKIVHIAGALIMGLDFLFLHVILSILDTHLDFPAQPVQNCGIQPL